MEELGPPAATLTLVDLTERAPPHRCRLWLPADTMFGLRYAPGTIKLVSVADSNGMPTLLKSRFSLSFSEDRRALLGDYCVPAELWPSPRLRSGMTAASGALSAALGSPIAGMRVLLHGLAEGMVETARSCEDVLLRVCMSEDGSAVLHGRRPSAAAEVQPRTPSTPASSAQRGRADMRQFQATPPSMRGSANSYPSPKLLDPRQERPSGKKSPAPKAAAVSSGTGSTPVSLLQRNPTNTTQAAVVKNILEDKDNLNGDKVSEILLYLVSQTLNGRFILQGNLMTLPLMGVDILLKIDEITGASENMPAEVTAATRIRVDGTPSTEAQEDLPSSAVPTYAQQALKAAAAAEGSESGPAALAAFQAASIGYQSLCAAMPDLGGLQTQMEVLRHSIIFPLQSYEESASFLFPLSGILLHGPPGTGKTALARATAADSKSSFFVINGPDVVSEYLGESETCLKGIFAAAKALAPSIIFIDEIDAIAPSRGDKDNNGGQQSAVSVRLVTTLLTELDAIKELPVVVLAATNRLQALDDSLRRPGRLDKELEVGVPSASDRLDILVKMLRGMHHALADDEILYLADRAHGFVGADLSSLCSEAAMCALRRIIASENRDFAQRITLEDFQHAQKAVRPSALREVLFETPKVKWEDIGGYEDVKQQLKEVVEWPLKFKDSLSRIGVNPPRGVLLYGPPGCSKTLLAKAVAREANMNFIFIKGPELFSKYVGETEKSIQRIFDKARASSPSILFFDEIDGMIGSRNDSSGEAGGIHVGERVLSQLLQEMDGLQSASAELIVIAATNRPDCLDAALLRPGRFDRLLYLSLPDESARQNIFRIHTHAMPLSTDVNVKILALESSGYSGADIASICQQAALLALEDDVLANQIKLKHLRAAMQRVVPSAVNEFRWGMFEAFSRRIM